MYVALKRVRFVLVIVMTIKLEYCLVYLVSTSLLDPYYYLKEKLKRLSVFDFL